MTPICLLPLRRICRRHGQTRKRVAFLLRRRW